MVNLCEIEPLLSTLARSLASAGLAREVAIITSAEPRLEWETHDNWGDVNIYNLILAIPYKLYDQIVAERETSHEVIYEHIKPLLGSFQNEWIDKVHGVIAMQPIGALVLIKKDRAIVE